MPTVPSQQSARVPVTASLGDLPFESAATAVLGRLRVAVAALLKGTTGPTSKCTDVQATLGLDPRLSWQVFRIATTRNPLAAGMNVPVRAAMRRLMKAAAKRRVPTEVIEQVSDAFDEYERFMQTHAEDREEFDAMIRSFLPQEREKQELATRQAAFKVMSQLKGATMEAELSTYILYPSQDDETVDRVLLVGAFGLRRLRPAARIGFATKSAGPLQGLTQTLDGQPSEGRWSVLLSEFCTDPLPQFEVAKSDDMTSYWVAGDDVGLRTSVDLVSAERRPGAMKRYREPGASRLTGVFAAPDPTKRTTVDLFIHKDLYGEFTPSLLVYDIVPRGAVKTIDDPTRANDRVSTTETIRALGRGLANADLPHVKRYVEMVEYVYSKVGLDAADFRGFRLDVQYPICGAQYILAFPIPER